MPNTNSSRVYSSAQDYSAAELRAILLDERIPVAVAIFDREQYTGTVTTDLFGQ